MGVLMMDDRHNCVDALREKIKAIESNAVTVDDEKDKEVFTCIERLILAGDKPRVTVRERLLRKGYEEDLVETALQRACQCGLVDDARYAASYIRSRINSHKGVYGIQHELTRVGIKDALGLLCQEYPYDEEWELQRALAVLERQPPRSKDRRSGAYRKLCSKGYESRIALRAACLWEDGMAQS